MFAESKFTVFIGDQEFKRGYFPRIKSEEGLMAEGQAYMNVDFKKDGAWTMPVTPYRLSCVGGLTVASLVSYNNRGEEELLNVPILDNWEIRTGPKIRLAYFAGAIGKDPAQGLLLSQDPAITEPAIPITV